MNAFDKHPVICLMGPTASGKTDLAIALSREFPIEIVSVDSAMVYRGMNIGTAKPEPALLEQCPHRLIDICDPSEAYSVAHFRCDARKAIAEIYNNGKIPCLVGGTMLYFRALQCGLSDIPSADPHIRARIAQESEEKGWPALHQMLQKIDPVIASRIHPNDRQRIQRALEVYYCSGKTLSSWQDAESLEEMTVDYVNLVVAPHDRNVLHRRIEQRFDAMLTQGFVEEVQRLYARGDLTLDMPAIRAVGYRQVWEHLQGKTTYHEMREKAIVATRQFAKRQLTWLRAWEAVHWFLHETHAENLQAIRSLIQTVMQSTT